jgi:hypothetical protein
VPAVSHGGLDPHLEHGGNTNILLHRNPLLIQDVMRAYAALLMSDVHKSYPVVPSNHRCRRR